MKYFSVSLLALSSFLFSLLFSNPVHSQGPAGDWFILGGQGSCWSSNIMHPAAKKLIHRGRLGRPLLGVSITPNDEWITLIGGTEIYYSDDLPAAKKLEEWWKDSSIKEFICVAFTPQRGWVVLANDNHWYAENIPANALKKMKELTQAKTLIRSIAFPPRGGWIILSGENGIDYEGIDAEVAKKLDQARERKIKILCTAFDYHGNWFIIASDNDYATNNPELPVAKVLSRLKAGNVFIKWVAFTPGDFPGECAIERLPTDKVRGVLTTDLLDPSSTTGEWILYAPKAPIVSGQEKVTTVMHPRGMITREHSPDHREMIHARVFREPRELKNTLTIDATLFERRLCLKPPNKNGSNNKGSGPTLTPEQVKILTRPSPTVDYLHPLFQGWLNFNQLRKREDEEVLSFARRLYAFIRHHYTYEYLPNMDRHASFVCRAGASDCGGLSCLMIAALRANGIPARALMGRWAISQDAKDPVTGIAYTQFHVKSEFFVNGIGWIPLDMSASVTDHDRGEYAHFGNDPGDFITMFLDHDFIIESYTQGKVAGIGMQNVWWWRRSNHNASVTVSENWVVLKEPIKKSNTDPTLASGSSKDVISGPPVKSPDSTSVPPKK